MRDKYAHARVFAPWPPALVNLADYPEISQLALEPAMRRSGRWSARVDPAETKD